MAATKHGSPAAGQPSALTPLASHVFPSSLAAAAGGQQASASTSSNVTRHLLPASISPTADLALVFTTTPPPPVAPAASAAGAASAPSANHAGLSAAQRLIQQRMAAMRARAAAAAGLPSGSSAGDASAGPIKGQPVEISLWRIGAEMELVWKQPIKVSDALFEAAGEEMTAAAAKEREQETMTIGGMQWSPNGRLIALQITVTRSTATAGIKRMVSMVALYTVQDGGLVSACPLQASSATRGGKQMLWVKLDGAKSLDRRDIPGSSSYAFKRCPGRPPVDLSPIIALAAASPGSSGSGGSSGAGRFQSLMGGGGGPKTELILPSQRGLESEHASKGGEGDKEDLLRGWSTLAATSNTTSATEMDLLLVPETDSDGVEGVWLLLQGRVPLAFLSLPARSQGQYKMVLCCIDQHRILHSATLNKRENHDAEELLYLTLSQSTTPFMSQPAGLTTLYHVIDLSSRLRSLAAQALDLDYLLKTVFKTLRAPSPVANGSLSAQQATSLPPLSRLHYALEQLATSHVQSMKNHLLTLLCTGIASEMIESLLLNTLVSGKWKSIFEETLRVYEAIEVTASEVGRVAEEMGGCISELQGWAEWNERSRPFLPDLVSDMPLSSYLQVQQNAISSTRSTAHKIIHYAQGERLAWDELNKWITWERERVEALNTDSEDQPYTARTFDPLVVIEVIQRNFDCPELHWLLLGTKSKLKAETVGDGKGDETEESFVRPREPQDGLAMEEKLDSSDALIQLELESRQAAEHPLASKVNLRKRLNDTLKWLQNRPSDYSHAPAAFSKPVDSTTYDEPPRLFQGEVVPNHTTSMYTGVPLTLRIRQIAKALKAIFTKLPQRLSGLESTTEIISLPLRTGWMDQDANEEERVVEDIVSLPSQSQQQTLSGAPASGNEPRQTQSLLAAIARLTKSVTYADASTGATVHQVILGSADHRKLLCLRVSGSGGGKFVEVALPFESLELLGHDKLLLVTTAAATRQREDSYRSHRQLDCIDLDILFEKLGQPLENFQNSASTLLDSSLPTSAVLLRQPLATFETQSEGVDSSTSRSSIIKKATEKRSLAVSTGRNIVAVLVHRRLVEGETDTLASTPTTVTTTQNAMMPTSGQKTTWTEQKVDFWDVVGAEEEEQE